MRSNRTQAGAEGQNCISNYIRPKSGQVNLYGVTMMTVNAY